MDEPQALPKTRDRPAQGERTYDDWLQLPDDGACYDVIDGALDEVFRDV